MIKDTNGSEESDLSKLKRIKSVLREQSGDHEKLGSMVAIFNHEHTDE